MPNLIVEQAQDNIPERVGELTRILGTNSVLLNDLLEIRLEKIHGQLIVKESEACIELAKVANQSARLYYDFLNLHLRA